MKRADLLRTIAEARSTSKSRARMLLERMLRVMGEPWVDAAMRAEIDAIAERCGRILDRRAHHGLSVGETWLLLVDIHGEGDVVRLCRHTRGAEAGTGFDAEVEHALRGLRAAARAEKRDLPPEVLFGKLKDGVPWSRAYSRHDGARDLDALPRRRALHRRATQPVGPDQNAVASTEKTDLASNRFL